MDKFSRLGWLVPSFDVGEHNMDKKSADFSASESVSLLLPILDASLDGCAALHEAEWVDQQAVVAGNLVSSRSPDDILAFNRNDCTV